MLDRRNLAELTDESKNAWVSRTEKGSSAAYSFFIGVRVAVLEHNLRRPAKAHRDFYAAMLRHLPGEEGYRSKQIVDAIKSEQQTMGPGFVAYTPQAPVAPSGNGNGKGRFGRLVSNVGIQPRK